MASSPDANSPLHPSPFVTAMIQLQTAQPARHPLRGTTPAIRPALRVPSWRWRTPSSS